jgi:hypothetical protein
MIKGSIEHLIDLSALVKSALLTLIELDTIEGLIEYLIDPSVLVTLIVIRSNDRLNSMNFILSILVH